MEAVYSGKCRLDLTRGSGINDYYYKMGLCMTYLLSQEGDWYVLSSAVTYPGEEYSKLLPARMFQPCDGKLTIEDFAKMCYSWCLEDIDTYTESDDELTDLVRAEDWAPSQCVKGEFKLERKDA